MAERYIKSFPDRPIRAAELDALRDSDAVIEAAPLGIDGERVGHGVDGGSGDAIRAVAVQVDETLYGLAFSGEGGWTVVDEREADDPEDLAAVRDALRDWVTDEVE